jgi:undecaprenyl-diphosphatase
MDYFISAFYGVIQGITEFFPISSSGHLAILPHFFKIEDPGVAFDLAMHLGTAASVALYFRKDILRLFSALFSFKKEKEQRHKDFEYALNMVISTVSTVLIVLVIKGFAKEYGRGVLIIGFNLIFFGFLMWLADKKGDCENSEEMSSLNFKNAISIGVSQAIAVFPGVSRSGATLTMARLLKMNRANATNYSFLLSLPIIVGGFIFKLPEFIENPNFPVFQCLFGMIISFVVGLLAIHFFLKVVSKTGLVYFSLYRFILGTALWLIYWTH